MVGSVAGTAYMGASSAQVKLAETAHVTAGFIPGGDLAKAHATLNPASVSASPGALSLPSSKSLPHGTMETAAVNRTVALAAYRANSAALNAADGLSETALELTKG